MLAVTPVHCRLIPVGEEDWLRESEDGVRELQQALQLEVEVRIRIHKVSSALLACMWKHHVLASVGLLSHATRCIVKLCICSSAHAVTSWYVHHGALFVLHV